ncbi:MAG: Lrp/AsnC ligand binding domain-containing protein, partial [Clostridia bacterium]|nr:Lrp/AsnC ligand binding domain-containing protein [Clostridia bacterium]
YLMSGAYDYCVIIEGKTMKQVARFVSEKLATIDSVLSTSTHFVLKKYKNNGVAFGQSEEDLVDERGNIN